MTLSIIAIDKEKELLGSAVASNWLAVGGCVQFFRPHVAFINFQNESNPLTAYRILDAIENGNNIKNSIASSLGKDIGMHIRQCVIYSLLDKNFYTHSGKKCTDSYRDMIGNNWAAAGNTLTNTNVVDIMLQCFKDNQTKSLAERLLLSIEEGQKAGGDSRGLKSASLKIYRFNYPIQNHLPFDLRIDKHPNPIYELKKLYHSYSKKNLWVRSTGGVEL